MGETQVPEKAAAVTLTFEQLKELLATNRETPEEKERLLKVAAELNATENRKLLKPENPQSPMVSVFSRHGGELKNPKGALKCAIFWVGEPLDPESLTAQEFDLANQIEPGVYRCQRSDGTPFEVKVDGERDTVTGAWRKLDVRFPVRGQFRNNLPLMTTMLKDMVSQHAAAQASAAPPRRERP